MWHCNGFRNCNLICCWYLDSYPHLWNDLPEPKRENCLLTHLKLSLLDVDLFWNRGETSWYQSWSCSAPDACIRGFSIVNILIQLTFKLNLRSKIITSYSNFRSFKAFSAFRFGPFLKFFPLLLYSLFGNISPLPIRSFPHLLDPLNSTVLQPHSLSYFYFC